MRLALLTLLFSCSVSIAGMIVEISGIVAAVSERSVTLVQPNTSPLEIPRSALPEGMTLQKGRTITLSLTNRELNLIQEFQRNLAAKKK